MSEPIEVFFSFAPEDEYWRKQLEIHLASYKRQGLIQEWDVDKTLPGSDWTSERNIHLKAASIIVLLISPDFINSEECNNSQLEQAIQRHKAGTARVIPILVRPIASWQDTAFAPLQALPRNGKALSTLRNKDQALVQVATDIRQVIEELRTKQATIPAPSPDSPGQGTLSSPVWHVPFQRNRFFTGREDILNQLHTLLQDNQTAALSQPLAMSGLGGIGKTQTAVEYAYSHRSDYQAVCWVKSSTLEELAEDFASLAQILHLSEQQDQEQARIIAAVKRWFETHTHWLLIFDNADELDLLSPYLPQANTGHVIITTREYATSDIASKVEMPTMSREEGTRLLLRRAGLITQTTTLEQTAEKNLDLAHAVIHELGGLPLALDQAGAYIEETGIDLAEYLMLYQQQREELLQKRGGHASDHAPVATTWTLAFQNLEDSCPNAIELIRLCAFLAPDAIPEEVLTKNAKILDSTLHSLATNRVLFNDSVKALLKYSLIQRDPSTKTLSIHRLVQAVIKDSMKKTQQAQWAERVVLMISHLFPFDEPAPWTQSQQYLSHTLIAVAYIRQWSFNFLEARQLIASLGVHFRSRCQYSEAEPFLQLALTISEKFLGRNHPETAASLGNLAILYTNQGKYEQAEPLFQRALTIDEQQLGANHPDTATSLNNLALLYHDQGKYEQAEPLFQHALTIREQQLGANHPDTATSLNNLGVLYRNQGKYEQAEPLFQRALAIRERQSGANHPDTATNLNNLGVLYRDQGKYEQAEPLIQRALAIREQRLGADHPDTATHLSELGVLYREQGKYEQAESLIQRALAIREQQLGANHPDIASSLNDLAILYSDQGKYEQAEPLIQHALATREQRLGIDHPKTIKTREHYAQLQQNKSKVDG